MTKIFDLRRFFWVAVIAVAILATFLTAPSAKAQAGDPRCAPTTRSGTNGNDILVGTPGDDRIDALAGDDTLNGGPGFDTCIGGPGTNTFINCERIV